MVNVVVRIETHHVLIHLNGFLTDSHLPAFPTSADVINAIQIVASPEQQHIADNTSLSSFSPNHNELGVPRRHSLTVNLRSKPKSRSYQLPNCAQQNRVPGIDDQRTAPPSIAECYIIAQRLIDTQ